MPMHLFYIKKFKPEEIIEECQFYKVVSGDNHQMKSSKKYIVICKNNDDGYSFFETDEYKIIGKTLIYKNPYDEYMIFNDYEMLVYGVENRRVRHWMIDSYVTALVDSKEQIIVKYTEEVYPNMGDLKKYKIVRLINDEGQFYKKQRGAKIEIINENVSNNTNCV